MPKEIKNNAKVKELKCPQCEKEFKEKWKMEQHIKGVHAERNFKCATCDKSFKTQKQLKSHENTHTTVAGENYEECPVCSKKVKVLIKHMINQHHEEELKHECQVCKKKFISGSHLSRHSRIHNGIQPNRQCMICYKSFEKLNDLKEHVRTAYLIRERRFKCRQCLKTFVKKDHLNNHVNAIHLQMKPFKCSKCHKAFTQKALLKTHMKIHSDKEKEGKLTTPMGNQRNFVFNALF